VNRLARLAGVEERANARIEFTDEGAHLTGAMPFARNRGARNASPLPPLAFSGWTVAPALADLPAAAGNAANNPADNVSRRHFGLDIYDISVLEGKSQRSIVGRDRQTNPCVQVRRIKVTAAEFSLPAKEAGSTS
jgi:hypothetical protein